jgi:hypothetical protein
MYCVTHSVLMGFVLCMSVFILFLILDLTLISIVFLCFIFYPTNANVDSSLFVSNKFCFSFYFWFFISYMICFQHMHVIICEDCMYCVLTRKKRMLVFNHSHNSHLRFISNKRKSENCYRVSSHPLVTGPKILGFIFVTLSTVDLGSLDHLKCQGELVSS